MSFIPIQNFEMWKKRWKVGEKRNPGWIECHISGRNSRNVLNSPQKMYELSQNLWCSCVWPLTPCLSLPVASSLSSSHCVISKTLQLSWRCASHWGPVTVMQLLSSYPLCSPCCPKSPMTISLRRIGDLCFSSLNNRVNMNWEKRKSDVAVAQPLLLLVQKVMHHEVI